MLDYNKAPNNSGESFKLFVEEGVPTGSFLEALLSNNLSSACSRADHVNRRIIYEYVYFMWEELPSAAWGSPERYKDWLQYIAVLKAEGRHKKFLSNLNVMKNEMKG